MDKRGTGGGGGRGSHDHKCRGAWRDYLGAEDDLSCSLNSLQGLI